MKKYKLNMIIMIFILVSVIVLSIIRNYTNNVEVSNVLNTLVLFLGTSFLIYLVLSCFYIICSVKKDNEIAVKCIKEKKIEELEMISKRNIRKYIFLRQVLNSKYNLLISYFASGKNNEAFKLMNETKWRLYNKNVYAYKIFELLYNENVDDARLLYVKLSRLSKGQDSNTEIVNYLFDLIDKNIRNEKLSKTIYPIVEIICKKYEK